MGKMSHLWIVLAVTTLYKQVFSVETPVFVLKGQDVRLDLKKPVYLEARESIIWSSNISERSFIRYSQGYSPPTEYGSDLNKNKAELLEGNFSLILKDLQQTDSGLYRAKRFTTGEVIIASYLIMIQERVDPPVLTVNCSINDSWSVNMTCRTSQGSSVSSSCDSSTCFQWGGVRGGGVASAAPLHVYVSGWSIICNHSNQVSWEKAAEEIAHLCPFILGSDPLPNLLIIILIVCIIVLLLVGGSVLFYCWKQRSKTEKTVINSEYDSVQIGAPAANQETKPAGPSADSTIYTMVQLPTPPMEMVQQPANGDTNTTPLPESLYAQVNKTNSRS